ncbi:hypothetical protein ElyMa_003419000 [Elysia marginata]|uniref:Uncharacterized protein n=1 Tax=Elysia marginata TaxID=1093978 RepID=A0AAV4JS72_9GAST|nr:hypothetical protein ElyMa_003419000 [Elysia marginata]
MPNREWNLGDLREKLTRAPFTQFANRPSGGPRSQFTPAGREGGPALSYKIIKMSLSVYPQPPPYYSSGPPLKTSSKTEHHGNHGFGGSLVSAREGNDSSTMASSANKSPDTETGLHMIGLRNIRDAQTQARRPKTLPRSSRSPR